MPAPPSVTKPEIARLLDFRLIAVAPTEPVMLSSPVSVMAALLPPLTAPLTVRGTLSFSAKPAAVKAPSVAIWFAPVSVAAPAALPDSVPAIMVPVSAIVPVVAISATVPAPPSVIVPGIVMLPAVRLTAAALRVFDMVSDPPTAKVKLFAAMLPSVPIVFPGLLRVQAVPAPVSVPTSKGPPGSVIAPLVKSAIVEALPPVRSTTPSIEMPVAVCVIVPPFGTSV